MCLAHLRVSYSQMRRLYPLVALFLALRARAEMNPEWTTLLPPFQIADNLYYVGSQDLAAYLVTTPAGNILINANLQISLPQIRASVRYPNRQRQNKTAGRLHIRPL